MLKRKYLYTVIILFLAVTQSLAQHRNNKTSRQIEALIKEKKSRSVVEQKIDSQLLQAIKEYSGKKITEGTALEPANVLADKDGNLKVDISARLSNELLDNIKKLGGKILYPSWQYNTVRVQVHITRIETIASYEQVKFIQAAVMPASSGS